MIYDAIIIGAGAAGLFCAVTAGKRHKRVIVLEHNAEVGRKIIISGGGRCNFTNVDTTHENFISQNPHFCKSALARYTPADFVDLVRKHKVDYYEKKLGQLFCRLNSRQIVEMLVSECRAARVEIRTGCRIKNVSGNGRFTVETDLGVFAANCLVVACGGLSFPKVGASDLGYRIAEQFDLKLVQTRPSLVALVLDGESYGDLAGVSMDSVVSAGKQSFRDNILFTHRGMSGPAILQASNYWQKKEAVSIDLAPSFDLDLLLTENRSSRRHLGNLLAEILPQRFAETLARTTSENKPVYQMTDAAIEGLKQRLTNWQVTFRDTEGYGRAEVTLGGVATAELSSKTMQSTKVRGLYFIGEVVDVTGWLGGYNFQWAWSSAHAAGSSI